MDEQLIVNLGAFTTRQQLEHELLNSLVIILEQAFDQSDTELLEPMLRPLLRMYDAIDLNPTNN